MKTWLRMVIVIVTVGGGFTGLVVTTQLLFMVKQGTQIVLAAFAAALYAFVLTAGLLFVHDARRLLPVIVAVALQVPFVSSPVVSYRFTAGTHGTVGIVAGNVMAAFRVGSDFQFTLLQPQPWGAGLNVVALLLLVPIIWARLGYDTRARATGIGT